MTPKYYPNNMPRDLYDDAREKRREKMFSLMGVTPCMRFEDPDQKLSTLVDRLSGMMDARVEMRMLGMLIRVKSISSGRANYLWMTIEQGEERYVCMVWPRPMFSEGVTHYATSESFIDRVRMTTMMVSEDQLDFS